MVVEAQEGRTNGIGRAPQAERVSARTAIPEHASQQDLILIHGAHSYKSAKKTDLEIIVEEHLNTNSSTLSKDAKLTPFYTIAEIKSPAEKKPRQRRQTIKAQDIEPL